MECFQKIMQLDFLLILIMMILQGGDAGRLHQRPLPALHIILHLLRGRGEAGGAARGQAREAAGRLHPRLHCQPRE